jgi:two-component system response regulator YesN
MKGALKLGFYGAMSIENMKEISPQHYMSFIHYKEVAEELHQNGSAKIQESLAIIDDIISSCKSQHIYPEIACRFFIKVLEHIEFLSKNMSLQTHEYLADMKEYLRFCNSSEELLAHMEQSLQSVYTPQELHELDTAQFKNEISKALKYIEENYQQKLSLSSIAEYVNFSTNYLCRSFKEEVGINVISYINNLRMKKAGELLKQKDSLVKEVSMEVGIDDQLYFSRLFKKYYGMSPSEYKNQYM